MAKKVSSVLLPYKIINNEASVFLQKRDQKSKVLPGFFAFFGGKSEKGETPEKALEREIQEELSIALKKYELLGNYPSSIDPNTELCVYVTEVDDAFESEIKINEGEGGKFFSEQQVINEPRIIASDKLILHDLFLQLKGKPQG